MVAPLKKKNTLSQTGFKLTDSGIFYKGIEYDFNQIAEASRHRHRLETKVLLVGSDYTHSISILFKMFTGEQVQLTEQPTMFSSSKEENVEKTFKNRVKKYLEQIDQRGFFEYSGWHFYPKQNEIINYSKGDKYKIEDIRMLKSYGFIEIKNKNEDLGQKLRHKIKGSIGINTVTNTDVFFALLKHCFNLEWKN